LADGAVLSVLAAVVLFAVALLAVEDREALWVETTGAVVAVSLGVPFAIHLLHRERRAERNAEQQAVSRFAEIGLDEVALRDSALAIAESDVSRHASVGAPELSERFEDVAEAYVRATSDIDGPERLGSARRRMGEFYATWNEDLRLDNDRRAKGEAEPPWQVRLGDAVLPKLAPRPLTEIAEWRLSDVFGELEQAWYAFSLHVQGGEYPGMTRRNKAAEERGERIRVAQHSPVRRLADSASRGPAAPGP
jgi:hypothetical protein